MQQQQAIAKELFNTMNSRSETACNFIPANSYFGSGARVVYRQYATLFFAFVIDGSESELGILDLIQVEFDWATFVSSSLAYYVHTCLVGARGGARQAFSERVRAGYHFQLGPGALGRR